MIYIVQGDEELFVKNKINEIVKDFSNAIKIDANSKDFDYKDILEALNGNNLFCDSNIILVKDAPFLSKKVDEDSIEELLKYCENPIYENELIFYTLENNHNSKLKVYKKISENAEVIICNGLDYRNFDNYLRSEVKRFNIKLNNDCINHLSSICKRNATLLNQNLIILSNYPDVIDNKVIDKLCTSFDDDNAFELVNAIISSNVSNAIELERKMFNDNDSLMSIIGLLASQLRFLYQFRYMLDNNVSKKEILDTTKISEYRYNKTLALARNIKADKIMFLLAKLSDFDIKSKTNYSLSDKERFELFIIQLLK